MKVHSVFPLRVYTDRELDQDKVLRFPDGEPVRGYSSPTPGQAASGVIVIGCIFFVLVLAALALAAELAGAIVELI